MLRDALRAPLPPKTTFNMQTWRMENECGTVCCAVGLAMGMPAFQDAGLCAVDRGRLGIDPKFGRGVGFSAVEALFDLTSAQARWLFDSEEYGYYNNTQPAEVADRIDALMTGGNLAIAKRIVGKKP